MAKNWWFKFDMRAWQSDSNLRRCSPAARCVWLELLLVMYEKETFKVSGSYEELSQLTACTPSVFACAVTELKEKEVANVTLGNGIVTLLSRRLKRELTIREQTRLRVQRHRGNGNVTVQSKKKEVISNKEEEKEAAKPPAHTPELEPEFVSDTDLSQHEEGMVQVYHEFFPDHPLSPFLQDLIAARVDDLATWRKALTYWQYNSYRPSSVGKICDYYDEIKAGKTNGTNFNRNGKRTDADVLKESADFYANYPDIIA